MERVESKVETKIISVREDNIEDSRELLREAGEVLKSGGIVAFPTETVYGLGGDALNKDASRKIYEAKGRPSDNPLIVHIAEVEAMEAIVSEVTEEAKKIAAAFWPGPLTMILPKSEKVPMATTGGLDTVAIRLPSHKVARELIKYAGGYVAAPSANTSGKPSPTVAKYVIEDMSGRVDMIIDGGEVGIGLESTIIDLTVNPPQILRPGFVTQEMLNEVLGEVSVDKTILHNDGDTAPRAPGMKYRHYAPKGELTIVNGEPLAVVDYINARVSEAQESGLKVGIICSEEQFNQYRGDSIKNAGSREDEGAIAKHLYRILREFDDENVDLIYSEAFYSEGMGQAIMNRLLKAAGHREIHL